MVISNVFGVTLGYVSPPLFVGDEDTLPENKSDVRKLMLFWAIIGTVLMLPSFFLFKTLPIMVANLDFLFLPQ